MCVSLCLCLYQHEHHSFVLLACFCNSDLEVVCFYVVIVFPFGGLFCFEGIPCHAKYHRFKRKERKKEKKKKRSEVICEVISFWYAYQKVSENAPTSLEVFSRSTSFLRNGFSFPNIVQGKINVSVNSLQKIIRKPLQIYSLSIDLF